MTPTSPDVAAFLASVRPLLIDNEFRDGSDPLPVEDPSTAETILRLGQASRQDVDEAVAAARRAFEGDWSRMPAVARARLMYRLGDLIERDQAILAELETLDNGIPTVLARHMALPLAIELIRYYAGWVTKIEGRTLPASPGAAQGAPTLTYTRREPIGVAAQIVPWNFPLGMMILKIAPALAAGCTVVLKPAELTPLTALYVGKLIIEAGFPPGVVNIVNGLGSTVGAQLASHPGVDKISFTGSTAVGRSVLQAAAGNLKKVTLELGGKSPVIIFADADLSLAIPGAAMAAFLLQGQNCMAGTRLYVEKSVYEPVLAGIEAIAKSLKVGAPTAMETMIGPLISKGQQDRVMGFIASGVEDGAELVTGGKGEGPGYFVTPTLFSNTDKSMKIVKEEIFGPVISAQVFDGTDLDELGRSVNDTVYGLSGSVWTRDLSKAHRMAHIVRAGQVSINCHGAVDVMVPFGGMKQSGWGREYGEEALSAYLDTKAITARL